jgi:hypothetical protein
MTERKPITITATMPGSGVSFDEFKERFISAVAVAFEIPRHLLTDSDLGNVDPIKALK